MFAASAGDTTISYRISAELVMIIELFSPLQK